MQSKTYRPVKTRQIAFLLISAVLFVLLSRVGILASLLGLCLTIFTCYASFVSKGSLTTSEHEISIFRFDQTKKLLWHEIDEIADYKLWLILSNRDKNTKIPITCFLENYREIREFIAKKRPDLLSE